MIFEVIGLGENCLKSKSRWREENAWASRCSREKSVRELGSRGLAGAGKWGGAATEMEGYPGQKCVVKSERGRSSEMTREHHGEAWPKRGLGIENHKINTVLWPCWWEVCLGCEWEESLITRTEKRVRGEGKKCEVGETGSSQISWGSAGPGEELGTIKRSWETAVVGRAGGDWQGLRGRLFLSLTFFSFEVKKYFYLKSKSRWLKEEEAKVLITRVSRQVIQGQAALESVVGKITTPRHVHVPNPRTWKYIEWWRGSKLQMKLRSLTWGPWDREVIWVIWVDPGSFRVLKL